MDEFHLPAEWYPQDAIQLTWPHQQTDWGQMLDEVLDCFNEIALHILRFESLIVVAQQPELVPRKIIDLPNYHLVHATSNDSWARDHGGITVVNKTGMAKVYDFKFNGWGLKYPSDKDNQLTKALADQGIFNGKVQVERVQELVLEGGAIESNGKGCLLTTSSCLLSQNRNEHLSKFQIEKELKLKFGISKVLWLDHGWLEGDDTDGHIDMLARFCSETSIAYVKCRDVNDKHFEHLSKMEEQLKTFKDQNGQHFTLIPLPFPEAILESGERLPATYANFLIINGAVLVPHYGVPQDGEALDIFREIFSEKEIIGINCLPLIKQHGSLHCVTMQYPKGILKN